MGVVRTRAHPAVGVATCTGAWQRAVSLLLPDAEAVGTGVPHAVDDAHPEPAGLGSQSLRLVPERAGADPCRRGEGASVGVASNPPPRPRWGLDTMLTKRRALGRRAVPRAPGTSPPLSRKEPFGRAQPCASAAAGSLGSWPCSDRTTAAPSEAPLVGTEAHASGCHSRFTRSRAVRHRTRPWRAPRGAGKQRSVSQQRTTYVQYPAW